MSIFVNCTKSPEVTLEEKEVLKQIQNSLRYPIGRFELRSSRDDGLISTALNYVHLETANDSMEDVKKRANILIRLEEKGLIGVCFSKISYVKSDYQIYHDSDLFELLNKTTQDAKNKEGFLFDETFLKKGIVKLTLKGIYAIK